jgi:hypothetical protein
VPEENQPGVSHAAIHRWSLISLEQMLKGVVEGYLFDDLDTMISVGRGVAYPIVMAVLSGCELLGYLLGDDGVADAGHAIERYWRDYMARIKPRYGPLAAIARHLCRNGIAHVYLSKPGVAIVRGEPDRHLKREPDGIVFDCLVLAAHFKRSYLEHARADIMERGAEAQQRLDDLMRGYKRHADCLLRELPLDLFPEPPLMTFVDRNAISAASRASGASEIARPGPTVTPP